jgi:hypothetical protein
MDLLCKWCKEIKPEDLFIKRVTSEPYSQSNVRCCRECSAAYQRERYKNPVIKAKQLRATKAWLKAHPERVEGYTRKFLEKRPNNLRARNKVAHNLRRGYWKKKPCEVCSSMTQVEAHHDSYAEPHWETVRWLCKDHHEQWHQRLNPVKNQILEEPIVRVEKLRDEAAELQKQITAMRDRHRDLHAQANALELSTWNKVIEAAQPMFDEFLKTA